MKNATPLIDSAARLKRGVTPSRPGASRKGGSITSPGATLSAPGWAQERGGQGYHHPIAKNKSKAAPKRLSVPVLEFGKGLTSDGTTARNLREWLDDQRSQGKKVPRVFKLSGLPNDLARVRAGKVLASDGRRAKA